MQKGIHLILGASGVLGQAMTQELLSQGNIVRALDIACDVPTILGNQQPRTGYFEVVECSIFDYERLEGAMNGVHTVYMFVSFSVPSTEPNHLGNELDTTLKAMELVLSAMTRTGVSKIVFPSSGGTIYGNIGFNPAREDHPTQPLSSYGQGKLISEEMIRFYSRLHSLDYLIMRISNIYGAIHQRRISQGVIDVFLKKIRRAEPLQIWGSTKTIRDYIFLDDFVNIAYSLIAADAAQLTVNVGSGVPTSLEDVLNTIENVIGYAPTYQIIESEYPGLPYSVLDITKLKSLIGDISQHDLSQAIRLTWERLIGEASEDRIDGSVAE